MDINLWEKLLFYFAICIIYGSQCVELCDRFKRDLLQHQCELTPEAIEGPYYFPNHLIRKDIREGREGIQLNLQLIVTDVTKCEPLENVTVDIWLADALGYYSGYLNSNLDTSNLSNVPAHIDPSDNSTFLRGVQITDRKGIVEFITIFPGCYSGRAVHIHIAAAAKNGTRVFTGQLYFAENMIETLYKLTPYSLSKTQRIKNNDDLYYRTERGNETTLDIRQLNVNSLRDGLTASMIVGINPNHNRTSII